MDNESEMPRYRKFGNKVLDKMTNAASELPFKDTQSGFRAYSKKAIDKIKFYSDGYASDSEILVSASEKGLQISEEKINVKYDTGSKTSNSNPVSHSTDVITKLIELIAIKSPLKLLGIPGITLFLFGLFYSGVVISIFNQTGYFSVPSTLVALGSVVSGLLFILTAIILFTINRLTNQLLSVFAREIKAFLYNSSYNIHNEIIWSLLLIVKNKFLSDNTSRLY